MKALVGAFNQEKALVGAFSVIMNLRVDLRVKLYSLASSDTRLLNSSHRRWLSLILLPV